MLWFDQWLEWWRWLILSWHVVLEIAKDRILGVDTPGQHMPPRVRYGTICEEPSDQFLGLIVMSH
jgi:hypothetical protein